MTRQCEHIRRLRGGAAHDRQVGGDSGKRCSDKYNVTELLTEIGCNVEYIGDPISEAVREGYIPMVW